MLLRMTTQTTNRPGTSLAKGGLFFAGLMVLVMVVSLTNGGHLTAWTVGAFLLGVLLAAVGFARRVLHAVETR